MLIHMKTLMASMMFALLIINNVYALTPSSEKLVIAHRGASGYLPEHTLYPLKRWPMRRELTI